MKIEFEKSEKQVHYSDTKPGSVYVIKGTVRTTGKDNVSCYLHRPLIRTADFAYPFVALDTGLLIHISVFDGHSLNLIERDATVYLKNSTV